MTYRELMTLAENARQYSYFPYSNFSVGAALLCSDGTVYTGCNIENSSFSPTVCAERVAVFKAVSEGRRDFSAIAVVGGPAGKTLDRCAPCGVCRQVLSEFCGENFVVLLGNSERFKEHKLGKLIPLAFSEIDVGIKETNL